MGFCTDKWFVFLGFIALAHAGYSAAQYRAYLRLIEQEFVSLPTDILLQCLVGLVITCYGIVKVVGDFKEIKAVAELQMRTWETLSNRPSFYSFNHRGKIFPQGWVFYAFCIFDIRTFLLWPKFWPTSAALLIGTVQPSVHHWWTVKNGVDGCIQLCRDCHWLLSWLSNDFYNCL